MIKFEDLLKFIGSSANVIFVFFAFSATAVALNKYDPMIFEGLPEWVLPALRLLLILSSVALLVVLFRLFGVFLKKCFAPLVRPFKEIRLDYVLLGLNLPEIFLLSVGLAQHKRDVNLPPNDASVLSLSDKGLITENVWLGGSGNLQSFNIPEDVWRRLIHLTEFEITKPEKLIELYNAGGAISIDDMANLLPSQHPSVKEYLSRKRES